MRRFAEEIINRKLTISYFVFFRSSFYKKANPELMHLLSRSGLCEIFIGTEANNNPDLKRLGKAGASVEDNENSIKFFRKYDVYPEVGFINFNPYSTFEGLRQNTDFLEKYRYACFFRNITFVRLYKGCRLYDMLASDGLLKHTTFYNEYGYQYIDKRIEHMALFLIDFFFNLGENIVSRVFKFERYYGDRLSHFKKHFKNRKHPQVSRLIVQHEQQLDQILVNLNERISFWFRELLNLAESRWNNKEAQRLSHDLLERDYLLDTLNYFDKEKIKFLKYVARVNREYILYL
jgi:hypothetical protein